ncbi:hypothetical protein DFA_05651 [Cavenderia fasciculata]|uniref:Uncharacterized protein n=1 Tax=Cavenderia fasciculata TaxID=261658 RepID=F4PLW4_CACFS|nr:uncharacterized protein DFA_05651 [Cavenderia fasciculata]EGG23518.1 hypothetical protein DFA_05651 [Cavenderia fasciculata]|eukprot:XP_004361369.1 hypothetical protein DFA_05651 [Cavenderia fasciculata]
MSTNVFNSLVAFNKLSIKDISKNVSYSLLNTVKHLSSKEKIIIASASTAWLGFAYYTETTSTITDQSVDQFIEILERMMDLAYSIEGINELYDMDYSLMENIAAWLEYNDAAMTKLEPQLGRILVILARFLHNMIFVLINSEEGGNPLPVLADRFDGFRSHPIAENLTQIWRTMLLKYNLENESTRFIVLSLLSESSHGVPLETFPTKNILSFYHQLKPLYNGGWTYDSIDQTLNRLANILVSRYDDGDIEEPLEKIESFAGYRYRRYIPHWILSTKETILLTALGSSLAVGSKVVSIPMQLNSLSILADGETLMGFLGLFEYVTALVPHISIYIMGRNNYKAIGVALAAIYVPLMFKHFYIKKIEKSRQTDIYKQKTIVDLRHHMSAVEFREQQQPQVQQIQEQDEEIEAQQEVQVQEVEQEEVQETQVQNAKEIGGGEIENPTTSQIDIIIRKWSSDLKV